jgi:predicted phage terminase large subunit-like protein
MLKRHWFRYWQSNGANLPPVPVRLADGTVASIPVANVRRFDEVIQSWDCSFKDVATADYVVGQVWGRVGCNYVLIDQVRGRMDCPATVKAIRHLSAKYPVAIAKLIEDKANGPAVIQMLGHEIPGLIPVTPEGGKMARAAAVSPLIEAGKVYLLHPQLAPWVDDFIEECAAFPNGAHDDQVDAMTQALLRWLQVQSHRVVYSERVRISPV